MNKTQINVNLNLDKKNNILPIRNISQGTNNFALVVSLFANSTAFTIPVTATARIYIKKPDGTLIYNDCTIANNKVTANLTTQATLSAGMADVEIEITDTDSTIARTQVCKIEIAKSNIDNTAIESTNEFTALEQALLAVGDITNKLDKTGDSKDCTVTFTEAITEADIVSGEKHSILFGKILKSIKTFRNAIGTLSTLTTTAKTSLVLAINELVASITTINTNLTAANNKITALQKRKQAALYIEFTNYYKTVDISSYGTLPAYPAIIATVNTDTQNGAILLFARRDSATQITFVFTANPGTIVIATEFTVN